MVRVLLVKEKTFSQIMIVSGTWDHTKKDFLKNIGLTIDSEWFVGRI